MQFLVSQGVEGGGNLASAQGFGDASPIASNATAKGRKRTDVSSCRGAGRQIELARPWLGRSAPYSYAGRRRNEPIGNATAGAPGVDG